MNANQKIALAKSRASLAGDIAALDAAIRQIAASGFASATLSSGGGSQSYTRLDLGQLRALRAELAARLAAVNSALAGRSSLGIRHIVTVRS